MLRNQNGSAIIVALFILVILSILGISSINTSIIEQNISTNMHITKKNFYTADSAWKFSPFWLKDNLTETDYTDINYLGEFQKSYYFDASSDFFKLHDFNVEITHLTGIDPLDGIEKVFLFGDADGDYLNEKNFTTGVPFELIRSYATHVRGGEAGVEVRIRFDPIFMMPNSALRVNSSVDGNGISGSIIGESITGSECENVADIMYDVNGGIIEYEGDLGETPLIELSTGMYPLPLIRPTVIRKATLSIIGSNNIDETLFDVTTADKPGIVYINGDSKATNLTGYGILFVDGNIELAGNLNWTGIILINGDMTFSGGGVKTIYGAIVGTGDAIAINGSVDIQYDCDVLSALQDNFSGYKLLSWKQI